MLLQIDFCLPRDAGLAESCTRIADVYSFFILQQAAGSSWSSLTEAPVLKYLKPTLLPAVSGYFKSGPGSFSPARYPGRMMEIDSCALNIF